MKIVAHRGYWNDLTEKNSLESFRRAFLHGYGVETDLRDYCGKLVISHDIADENSMSCDTFFDLYRQSGNEVPLALNIKADGLQNLLKEKLEKYGIRNYFVFDMSIPEMVIYKTQKIAFFTRGSDIEKEQVLYHDALGVWLDTFYNDQWNIFDSVQSILADGKKVVIVSPELHGKAKDELWGMLKQEHIDLAEGLYLCTDYPQEAEGFFKKGQREDAT